MSNMGNQWFIDGSGDSHENLARQTEKEKERGCLIHSDPFYSPQDKTAVLFHLVLTIWMRKRVDFNILSFWEQGTEIETQISAVFHCIPWFIGLFSLSLSASVCVSHFLFIQLSFFSFILLKVSIFLHVFYSELDLRKSQRRLDCPRTAHGPSDLKKSV